MKTLSGAVLHNPGRWEKLIGMVSQLSTSNVTYDEGTQVQLPLKDILQGKAQSAVFDENGACVRIRTKTAVGGQTIKNDFTVHQGRCVCKSVFV